jgi:hypothetical protein
VDVQTTHWMYKIEPMTKGKGPIMRRLYEECGTEAAGNGRAVGGCWVLVIGWIEIGA